MEDQVSIILEVDLLTRQTRRLRIEQLHLDPAEPHKIYWIHVDLEYANEWQQLQEKLSLPEESQQLCVEQELRSKLQDTTDSVTLLLQSPITNRLDAEVDLSVANLVIHLTTKFCLTASHQRGLAVKNLMQHYMKAIPYAKTPCFVLFLMLDETINTYSDLLYEFEELTEKIDLEIQNATYETVVQKKRLLMKTKRYIVAIRDMIMRISGRKMSVISNDCRDSLQKLLVHADMLVNEADTIRDFFHTMLDQIDNALMQRVNLTMRVLTVFSAIFLPLTLIAGIYGMNFYWIPELHWKYGYFWALGLMLVSAVGLFSLFKKKGWI